MGSSRQAKSGETCSTCGVSVNPIERIQLSIAPTLFRGENYAMPPEPNRLFSVWFHRALLAAFLLVPARTAADEPQPAAWSRFRGPNGQGVLPGSRIPSTFGPETHCLWKTSIQPGHSSPVIWGDTLFLTGLDPAHPTTLLTFAVDRKKGRVLWQHAVEGQEQPSVHPLNHGTAPTPVANDRRVYAYFGGFGVVCYDHRGSTVWQRKLPPPPSKYGAASSPILHGPHVILVLDGDKGSARILALDRETGEPAWDRARPLFKAGWSTPSIFPHDGTEDLVVLGSKRLTAYDPANGEERWWVGGFPDETVSVPVIGDGLIFAGAAALGGRGDDTLDASATWKMTVAEFDKNHDNQIQREEMTKGFAFIQRPELPKDNPGFGLPVRDMDALLRLFDQDKNGVITEEEWIKSMSSFAAHSTPNLVAIRPGAKGDARPAHIAWEIQRGIPETPSLLHCDGRLYLLRDGGLLTCLKASTGTELFRERIGAAGQYIASPIAAGDRLITASVAGVVTVIQTGDTLQVLSRNAFHEQIFATPALTGNRIYIRTEHHLYALGE